MPISPGELKHAAEKAGVRPMTIMSNRTCIGCGYSLRGLSIGGKCPECGLAILSPSDIDDPLSQAPLFVIKRFRFGCWLAMACILAQVWVVILQLRWPLTPQVRASVLFVAAVAWFLAAVFLTPAFHTPQAISWGFGRRGKLRLVARWLQLGWVLAYGANLLGTSAAGGGGGGGVGGALRLGPLAALGIIVGLFGLIVLGVILMRLAAWTRDDTAERWFNVAVWGIPVATLLLALEIPFLLLTWAVLLLWVVCVLAFPAALFSLSRSVMFAVHHCEDYQERLRRKHERDQEYHARLGKTAARTVDPSSVERTANR